MASLRSFAVRGARRLIGPIVPARWTLQFRHWLALKDAVELELRYLARIGPNRGIAIDAGANEGLYTYALSCLYNAVHAFEINPEMATWLRSRAPGNVTVHPMGLSSAAGTGELFIPVVHDKALTGWASLNPGNCPEAERWIQQPVQFQPLDALELTDVTFIKADVEGHEPQFLSGALLTIQRNRPVVLLEVKEQNQASVREYFQQLNYRETRLEELIGAVGSIENYVFVPNS